MVVPGARGPLGGLAGPDEAGADPEEREIRSPRTTVVQNPCREVPVILLWKLGLVERRPGAKLWREGRVNFRRD